MNDNMIHILVVEDEEAHAELIRRSFRDYGKSFQVTISGTLMEMRKALSACAPSLIITDMLLPDGNGLDLLGQQQEVNCPVIVMTSHGDEEAAVNALHAGALDYVVKSPETLLDLPHLVERTLREWGHIQETKKAQDSLEVTEEKYRLLAETARDIILTHDMDGRITYANQAALDLTAYNQESILRASVFDLMCPEHFGDWSDPSAHLGDRPIMPHLYETELCNREGFLISIEVCSSVITQNGKTSGILIVARDITERKRAEAERRHLEEQIQQAQKLESLGVLAGGIAHDFNNLLMGVLGNASLALQQLSSVSPARQSVESIKLAAQRAADLTKQLLAYSGRGKFIVQPIDLTELVKEMAHLLEVSVSKQAMLRYNISQKLPPIEADATQIRQVIMNLITNASEALADQEGVISINMGMQDCDTDYLTEFYIDDDLSEGSYVWIEVSDTGCGMDKDTREKIFDPFFTTKFTGRGLGLAAVLGIVRGHRGAVKVYSEPASGTTFKVLFPVSNKEVTKDAPQEVGFEGWRGSGTVLVVDDEEVVRELASKMLERVGFSVLVAKDGLEALEIFRRHHGEIALVLLDMTMPHMGGEETFAQIQRLQKDLPVILSSGFNEQEATQHFAGKGLAGFIQKPYEFHDLIKTVRSSLNVSYS